MATLEKIRQRSILLVSVIGVALVLFIITLVDNPFAMFQDTTSIAKVGGHKISIEEFNRRAELASQQQQQQNNGASVDNAVLQAQVLQQMMTEALMNEEYDKLGITVTSDELTQAMIGETAHPYISQWAGQFGTTPRQLYDMIFTPAQFGIDPQMSEQMKAQWIQMENAIENELKAAKFQALLGGAIAANKLDAKALFNENAKTYQIAYAKTDLYTVPDSAVNVSDTDLRALYKEHQEEYALTEPVRLVTYVNLPIVASAQDRLAAQQAVENAIVALREQPAMEGIAGQSAFIVKRSETPASAVTPAAVKTFIENAAVNDVELVSNTGTVMEIAKLLGKSEKVDEVTYDMVGIEAQPETIDSIKAVLAAAPAIDSVAGVTGSQLAQTMTLSTSGLPAEAIDNFRTKAIGEFFEVGAQGNVIVLARVTERKAPVTMVEYATATYNVEPSQETYNTLRAQMQHFLDSAATASTFTMENALRHNLSASQAMVSPSSPTMANIPESRDIVHWIMDAKKGQVSGIFNDDRNSRLTAVALVDMYSDYMPVSNSNVADRLRMQALNDKKAAKLIADYQGKGNNVAEYAAAMNTTVDTTTVNFSQMFIPRLGAQQSALTAAVASAKPGQVTGPMQANNSVVVFDVISVDESSMPYNQDDYVMNFNRSRGNQTIVNRIPAILMGRNKIENRTLKFYAR